MTDVFVVADNLITSLGLTTKENIDKIKQEVSGVSRHEEQSISPTPFFGSLVDTASLKNQFANIGNPDQYTRLEQLFILSIHQALDQSSIKLSQPNTLLILSTTKGNIDLLEETLQEKFGKKRVFLGEMASQIAAFFGCNRPPVIVSNACISGVLAQIMGARMIQNQQVDHVVVAGADITSEFTVSGFQCLKAISEDRCKPYDENRSGINLGEACGTLILSKNPAANNKHQIKILGGATSNDANHISGPSRTGEGLYIAIEKALKQANKSADQIDYLSAHGTATLYNDEMECKAFAHTNLLKVPVNSYKGYFGHTLGAAGTVESIVAINSLKENLLFKSLGLDSLGVSQPMNVITKTEKQPLSTCLKTASGFGGCNAAIVFEKK